MSDNWGDSYANYYDAVATCRIKSKPKTNEDSKDTIPGRGDLAERVLDFKSALKYCSKFANGGCAPSLLSRWEIDERGLKVKIQEKSSTPSLNYAYCPLQKWDLLSVVASGRIRDRDSLPEVADPDEVHLWIPQILLKISAKLMNEFLYTWKIHIKWMAKY